MILWLLAGAVSGLFLALIEVGMATLIQVLLKKLGILSADSTLPILGSWAPTTEVFVTLLIGVGGIRAFLTYFNFQSSSIAYEGINSRLRIVSIYKLLNPLPNDLMTAYEMNTKIGEVFPKTAQFFSAVAQILPVVIQLVVMALIMINQA
ncbi:MAG: hypothetical protein EOP04_22945, partial [Proteobacteria bacterium]